MARTGDPFVLGAPEAETIRGRQAVYLGVIFLIAALPKFLGDFPPRMVGFLRNVALQQGHPFNQTFITTTVLPHAQFVARLVMGAELLVAVSLIGGIATRLFALVAFSLTVNLYVCERGVVLDAVQ